jgi:hypothetical protein
VLIALRPFYYAVIVGSRPVVTSSYTRGIRKSLPIVCRMMRFGSRSKEVTTSRDPTSLFLALEITATTIFYCFCRAEFPDSAEILGHRRAGLSPRNPAEILLFDFQFHLKSIIFLVCAPPTVSTRTKYTPEAKPAPSNAMLCGPSVNIVEKLYLQFYR